MSEQEGSFVTYSRKHQDIVKSGIDSIDQILNGSDVAEKRSLLFCLDKYLDPYYGYDLPYFDEIILLLQKQLFIKNEKEVQEDIIQLLTDYSKGSLDYLADNIDRVEPELLADSIYALSCTYNRSYLHIYNQYEFHENQTVRNVVKAALNELSEIDENKE